ncbi:MAG: hypothetical protein H6708_23345 [Kofleriaceae bacterium]|nr:hypothetical protein [Myxococcales bacterium]MCB9563345.1 hypothetical protein [Kofleriaceae bacterium]
MDAVAVAVDAAAPAPDAALTAAADAPVLDWSLAVDGDRLRIDYVVTNGTARRIYLLDTVLVRGAVDDDAVELGGHLDGDTVTIQRGVIFGDVVPALPELRSLDPGARVSRTAHLPLPAGPPALGYLDGDLAAATHAILQVQYVPDPGARGIKPVHNDDGSTWYWIHGDVRWLVGERLALPVSLAAAAGR